MSAPEKTMIYSPIYGALFFDAVFRTDHGVFVTLTDHPVEYGANITDHAIREPYEISFDIGMSDTATTGDTIAGGSLNRSVDAYNALDELASSFEPLTVVTRLRLYENMVITSISAMDDVSTMHALKATVTLREIETVEVATVTVQQKTSSSKKKKKKKPSKKPSSGSGGKTKPPSSSSTNTTTPNQSILYGLTH